MSDAKERQELGLFDGISNDDYHAGPGISSSSVKNAAKALRLYRAYQTGEITVKQTEAMEFGTLVHSLILEADAFEATYAISPAGVRRPTSAQLGANKPAIKTVELIHFWEEFDHANQGKIVIGETQYDKAKRMRDAVSEHPEAGELLFGGQAEMSGYYLDQDFEHGQGTNMICKYRPDYRTSDYLIDLKTCISAHKTEFTKTIASLGYHISGAHYIAGDEQCGGKPHKQFILIAVEKTPPYMVGVYVISEKDLELGFWIRRKALNGIKKSREEKKWPGYNNDLAVKTDLPPYLFYDLENSKI